MNVQLENYTESTAPPYQCLKCDREFDHPQGVRMHFIRTHTKKRWDTTANLKRRPGRPRKSEGGSVECPICHATFASRKTMGAHMRMIHNKSIKELRSSTRHECPYCEFDSGTRTGLTKHMNNHHPGKNGLVELRPTAPQPSNGTKSQTTIHFCPKCGEDLASWKKI